MRRSLALLVAGGGLLASATAFAWDSPEHAAFGKYAIDTACAQTPNAIACTDDNRLFAGNAVAAPDFCHSYWFSTVGIQVNDVDADNRAGCGIRFGSPLPHPNGTWQDLSYLLITNANHFGDNTQAHYNLFHALALKAAQLGASMTTHYADPPDPSLTTPNPLIAQCTKTALGIEGFSLHYLTDRTAAGHAWDPEPRYDTRFPLTMHVLRSCFHGQPLKNRIGQAAIFSCVDAVTDAVSTSSHVLAGLGDVGRSFGGMYAGTGPWYSDEAFSPNATAQAHAAQDPAAASFSQVLGALNGNQGSDGTWTDTFVSDHDFCAVVLPECCRGSSVKGLLSKAGLGTCSSCLPDITDANIKSSCPVDQVVSGGVSGADWIPLQSNGAVYDSVYYAHLNFSNGGTGNTVARNLARTGNIPTTTVHPDATWDNNNDVITKSGCAQFDVTQATLPPAPLEGTFVTASVTYTGNPKFPLTAHWRANTDPSQGPVCTPTAGIPTLCQPQDYPIVATSGMSVDGGAAQQITIPTWACLGATTGSPTGTGPGYVYLTDANGAWTNGFQASFVCGTAEAGACTTVAPTPPPDAGGTILSCPGGQQLFSCGTSDASMVDMCGGLGAQCCNGGVCPNANGQCVNCGGSFMCVTAGCSTGGCSAVDGGSDSGM